MKWSGGGTSLSKKEREKIYEEVDAEFDADDRVSKKSKGGKSKKRIPNNVDDDLGLLFGGGLTGKRPRYANKITSKVYNSEPVLYMFLLFNKFMPLSSIMTL